MKITITASDGRTFTGTDFKTLEEECYCYEAELKSKKQKEEAERKEKEEKRKTLLQYRNTKLKEINEDLTKVVEKIRVYEKETGYKIIYSYDYSNGNTVAKDTPNNSIDLAWYSFADDFFNKLNDKK